MPKSRSQGLQSGDFLKVLKIVKNLNTDETILRGHKFVREKYTLGRGSDGSMARLNEVMMHLEVHEDDNRPAEVQGMVDVSATEVKSKREIITTQKPYPMKSFRDGSMETYQRLRSKEDIKREIFSRGPLVCRWSRTSIISPNGTAYGGILRLLSRKEVMIPTQLRDSQFPLPQPMSRTSPAQLAHQSQLREARIGKRPARTPSLETLDTPPQKRPATHPMKKKQYTFFDMYCGAGGASRGAVNAGLQVLGGLDFNENAMEAWGKNYPGGLPFCCNAFDFLGKKLWRILGRTDVLNISFPCQPYSSAQ
jgi:DNA (cytosine-5)-methyltransferase 1